MAEGLWKKGTFGDMVFIMSMCKSAERLAKEKLRKIMPFCYIKDILDTLCFSSKCARTAILTATIVKIASGSGGTILVAKWQFHE